MMEVVVWFKYRLLAFREAELVAVAGLCGVSEEALALRMPEGCAWPGCVRYARVPSEAVAMRIMERCLLVAGIFERWGGGTTDAQVEAEVRRRIEAGGAVGRYVGPRAEPFTFKFEVTGFGLVLTQEEKLAEMDRLSGYVDLDRGVVRLRDPDLTLHVLLSYRGTDTMGTMLDDEEEGESEEKKGKGKKK